MHVAMLIDRRVAALRRPVSCVHRHLHELRLILLACLQDARLKLAAGPTPPELLSASCHAYVMAGYDIVTGEGRAWWCAKF